MLANNSVQSLGRRMVRTPMRRSHSGRSIWDIAGGKQLLQSIGKFAAILCMVVFSCQLLLGFYLKGVQKTVEVTEIRRHELIDEHIALRAQRAALLTPHHIEKVAGTMLSLQAPEEGQVSRYNKQKGRFERL